MVQPPFTQPGVPFVALQTFPHVPQLTGLAPVFVSQPLPAAPSQSAKLPEQLATVQVPFTHCHPATF